MQIHLGEHKLRGMRICVEFKMFQLDQKKLTLIQRLYDEREKGRCWKKNLNPKPQP